MSEHLEGMPVIVDFPVAWGDMDAFGHVNNTQYFRWFEDGRLAYFEAIGIANLMETTGVGPILASTDCRFRVPLTYPDSVRIGASVTDVQDGEFTMRYVVVSTTHGRVAAEGTGRIVAFDYRAGTKATWPESLREAIAKLQDA
ncbi:acyl-CoA thioesterase [Nocardioides jejuensis]|nr:thioesterase family protein [Nocardioides jejuensis]